MFWNEYIDVGAFGEHEYEVEIPEEDIWEHVGDEVVSHTLDYYWDDLVDQICRQSDSMLEELIERIADVIGPARLSSILGTIQNAEDDD